MSKQKISFDILFKEKDAVRRFEDGTRLLNLLLKEGPWILKGPDFNSAVSQFESCLEFVEECWDQAVECFLKDRYQFSAFFSVLTLEETGKLGQARFELPFFMKENFSPPRIKKKQKNPLTNHSKKHIYVCMHGALVNSRLDRILGLKKVKNLIEEAESGEIEKLRKACLYIEFDQIDFKTPKEIIGNEKTKDLLILSGELLAEIGGVAPVQWERLIKKVSEVEKQLGFSGKENSKN